MIRIVLVETEGPENLGSIARAMMNMDCHDLVLVKPHCEPTHPRALNYAIHAHSILKNSKIALTLEEALNGSDLSVAVTRRVGQWRKQDHNLREFAQYSLSYLNKRVDLVFGREKSGLSNEEINLCDLVCSIPSSPEFPSINLAQSVMLVCYELYQSRLFKESSEVQTVQAVERDDFNEMMDQIITSLDEMEFFKRVPEWRLKNFIKKILLKAELDKYDTMVVRNLFQRIQGVIKRHKKHSQK